MASEIVSFLKIAGSAVAKIKVSNAITTLSVFCLVMGVFLVSAALHAPSGTVQNVLLGFGIFVCLIPIFGFVYFALKNPDYLRSESYHIQKSAIEILGTKSKLLEANAEHIVRIANPENRDEP